MENIKIQLKKGAKMPEYSTEGAACFDLFVHTVEVKENTATIGTGVFMELPHDKQLLVFSRSGHGFKNLVRLGNCVGVVDPDYRGEIKVKLVCDDPEQVDFLKSIQKGDKIAQAQLVPIIKTQFTIVDKIDTSTKRGSDGFGSTGR